MLIRRNSRLLIIGTLMFGLQGCQFTDLRAVYINNTTSKKLKEKPMDESQTGYLKALEIEPLLPAVHSNLGTTYDILKDSERALKLYKNAEEFSKNALDEIENQPLKSKWEVAGLYTTLFASLFNQAQLLARENKIDEALLKYQEALGLNPNSQEVKTNIELLMQKKQGGGEGESQDKNKDQNKDQNGKDKKDGQSKDDEKDQDKEGNKPKDYSSSPKYKPRDFKGELTKENVQKIFGEISQQEKKMRSQFSKQNQTKESPREKDW